VTGPAAVGAHDGSLKARAAWVSIAANAALIVFKLLVGVLSGSIGIISEAVHSATDLIAAVIALVSVRHASRPADVRHRYGHEKVENFSGVVEGAIIFAAAVVIVVEAVGHLISGETLDHIPLAIAVMLVSAGVNVALTSYLSRTARLTGSPALQADAANHLTDIYTSLGVAGGLALIELTGKTFFDPVLALVVAALIMWTAWGVVSQSTRVLLDEALPDEELDVVRATVAEHRGELITGYHKLRARHAGARHLIDLHVTVPGNMTVMRAHEIAEHIESDIAERLPNTEVLVHIEPSTHEREDES
ncbi:MAG TPA: cation diffusion facilitator family transporter, partial [Thermoleophilia bacterium]|nr:cation diffusion facilitator family transporter [Thermoleophilia bacterium]